jgi:acetyl-CoA carboxylase/biotin carboxylase 1
MPADTTVTNASGGFHTRFANIAELFAEIGGPKSPKEPVRRVLVANNGLAAVKGIRSIQQWLFDHVGDHDAIQFEVMATPEDLSVNAEFIRMAHHYVEVPGGSNANNYANVQLIVDTALRQSCDAVYPGWGHASENPLLPKMCYETTKVRFLGPGEKAMFALGDKIASTIIAQSMQVPTVPWSGDALRVPSGTLNIDAATYKKAYVETKEECVEVVKRVGFPVMLKASEGGGGKGIRKCYDLSDVAEMFEAIQEEVKGCHIFVMRMLTNVRHLEVQLLADAYGECIAVRTRDCSVQRRHQKIIEEGPVVGVDPGVIIHMEQAAIRMAKAVNYVGLGTVEYMFDKDTHQYCFLELNPRLQVEHPVSELISNVNLPAALLCVGLGVPLHRIPEVRAYYGEDPYTTSKIDFETRQPIPARGHAIAVRVTAEDTENGFRPTCGNIDEISFRDSRDCWGYFSVSSGGGIHQFADSQFGHIFATGNNREEARRSMALALRNLTIRGDIRTSTAYVLELLETRDFRECDCNTAWLDGLIANRPPKPKKADVHPALAAASIYRLLAATSTNSNRFASFLSSGHTPAVEFLAGSRTETFVMHTDKFIIDCGRVAPSEYRLRLNEDILPVSCRQMSHGALQMTIGGRNIVAYVEEEGTNLRVIINGRSLVFTGDADPTKLRSSITGRLVRFLAADGDHVTEGQAYCEVEVMKMILRLNTAVTGTIHLRAIAGSTLTNGKLLAEVEPDDPSKVARAVLDSNPWPPVLHNAATETSPNSINMGSTDASIAGPITGNEKLDSMTRARNGVDALYNMILGYHFEQGVPLAKRVTDAFADLASLSLSNVTLQSLNRPYLLEDMGSPATITSTSPIKKIRAVFAAVVNKFLEVEKWYDGKTREDALVALKDHYDTDLQQVYAIDFAHAQAHRQEVIRAILQYIDHTDSALMQTCKDLLENLAALHSTTAYGSVLLQARYLLRKAAVPSFDERKSELVRKIEGQDITAIGSTSVPTNLLCAVLFDRKNTHLVPPILEVIVRRFYYGEGTVNNVDVVKGHGGDSHATWIAAWNVVRENQTAPLGRRPEGPPGSKPASPPMPGGAHTVEFVPGVVALRNGLGVLAVFADERGLAEVPLGAFIHEAFNRLSNAPQTSSPSRSQSQSGLLNGSGRLPTGGAPPTTLYVFFGNRSDMTTEQLSSICGAALAPFAQRLAESTIERITFCAYNYATEEPHMFTFARGASIPLAIGSPVKRVPETDAAPFSEEDKMFRNMFPTIANRLELGRLRNYDISMFPTPTRKVHVFVAKPKGAKASPSGRAPPSHKRLFVRAYFAPGDVDLPAWSPLTDVDCGRIMNLVVSAVELAQSDRKTLGETVYNHLFINLVELTLDLKGLPALFRELARTYAVQMYTMAFREVEVKFAVRQPSSPKEAHPDSTKTLPFRIFITNHTMHSLNLEIFVEVDDGEGGVRLHRARFADDITGTFTVADAPHERTTWGGRTFTSALDLTQLEAEVGTPLEESAVAAIEEPIDPRWAALRHLLPERIAEPFSAEDKFATTHSDAGTDAYAPLSAVQLRRLQAQLSGTTYGHDWLTLIDVVVRRQWRAFLKARKLPATLVPAHPLEVAQAYLDELTDEIRLASNFSPSATMQAAGMLVWIVKLRTPADLNLETKAITPREVVLVANDITSQFGSFSVVEDKIFAAASVLARSRGVPFIYLSSNSGARLGLVNEVKSCFKVALKGDAIDYLYLTPDDYIRLNHHGVAVNGEELTVDGEKRFRIVDIIGSDKEHIGVENLQGSALIAGQMSLNYATVPTMSVVSGRSVGIGAYLVRLGRRVVQTKDSPIILTGAPAINKLLGKEVYSSNNQLGGTQIMLPNGVSHFPAGDDLDAVRVTLRWLDLMPHSVKTYSAVPRLVAQPSADPVDRDVTYSPAPATPYDPRFLITGDADNGTLGLFDAGSWTESLSDWAKTVVVGRATLGGIPAGVIVVETRSVRKYDPADPADPDSTASILAQAGQVWFPDSARKTADALEDFHREHLPCFILANWRGFSGGMRDMFDEVLKFGASIVDNLRVYNRPVFIYIPPFGELRGGAWVVVDPVINHNGCVTMYADPNARGGILEPSGMIEIKFRDQEIHACLRRNHPELAELAKTDAAAAKKREEHLRALYNDVALKFADLHDTPGRMKAKGCVADIVPWQHARRVFHSKLVRKTAELAHAHTLATAATLPGDAPSLVQGIAAVRRVADAAQVHWDDDRAFSRWATTDAGAAAIATEAAHLRAQALATAAAGGASSLDELMAALIAAGGDDVRRAMAKALESGKQ